MTLIYFMHYIILGCAVIIGIIVMIISYIRTPGVAPTELSSKLINTDVSLESAIEELELIDIMGENNNASNATVEDV